MTPLLSRLILPPLTLTSLTLTALTLIGGCNTMTDPADDRTEIERVIKSSITWAAARDTTLLYDCFVNDSTLFFFSPDNAGTVRGFDQFTQQVEQVFMDPRFKAVRADFKDLRIDLSRDGACAWWSCYLDDFNEWDGRPAVWENVRWTGVLEKLDGRWKIRQMHFSHATEDFQKEG